MISVDNRLEIYNFYILLEKYSQFAKIFIRYSLSGISKAQNIRKYPNFFVNIRKCLKLNMKITSLVDLRIKKIII